MRNYKKLPFLNMKGALLSFIFIFSFSLCDGQSWEWAKSFQCGDDDYPVATDKMGNVYKLIWDTCYIDTMHLRGTIGFYKLDTNGNPLHEVGSNSSTGSANGLICTDDSDNVFVSGLFTGILGFGAFNFASTGTGNLYLTKVDSTGKILWMKASKTPSTNSFIEPYAFTTDKHGNVYSTGIFVDTAVFDADTLMTTNSENPFFLVKYNNGGNVIWAKRDSTNCPNCNTSVSAITTDISGNIYVTGSYAGTVSFGAVTLNQGGVGGNTFIVKYDANGTVLWAKSAIPNSKFSSSGGNSITTDNAKNCYVAGSFADTILLGSFILISPPGITNGFLAKLDSSGQVLWLKNFTVMHTSNYFNIYSVVYNSHNTIFTSGGMEYPFIIDADTIKASYLSSDASFILKFDTAGNLLCSVTVMAGGDDNNAIASDPTGQGVYFSGDALLHPAIFGKDTINGPVSVEYPFLAKWQPCTNIETSIPPISNPPSLSLFPNPNTGQFTIAFAGAQNFVPATVEIYNVMGQKVYSAYPPQTPKGALIAVNIANQADGIYLYRVMDNSGALVGEGKFVIQK